MEKYGVMQAPGSERPVQARVEGGAERSPTHLNGTLTLLYYGPALLVLAVLAIWYHTLDRQHALSLLHENGPVEIATALSYGFCLMVMLGLGGQRYLRQHGLLVLSVALMGLRELDFDKRFTETGMLQIRIFFSPDVAIAERMAGLLLITFLTIFVIYGLRRYTSVFLHRLRQWNPVATGVAFALGLAFFSKAIDGLGRKLTPMGISVSEDTAFTAIVLEEVGELGIPAALAIASIVYFRCRT